MPEQRSRRRPGIKLPKFKFTVLKREGNCYHNYEVGDEFILDDFTHPPKHFCAGAVQCAFPCMYALTFGAEFKFMENMRSIITTCPDNGIITFKIEVLNDDMKIEVKPRRGIPPGPSPKEMEIEVEEVTGKCFYEYKKGDKFTVKGLSTPAGFCGAAYSVLFPVLFALNFGAKFPFEQDPLCKTGIACPDHGNLKFKVRLKESKEAKGE